MAVLRDATSRAVRTPEKRKKIQNKRALALLGATELFSCLSLVISLLLYLLNKKSYPVYVVVTSHAQELSIHPKRRLRRVSLLRAVLAYVHLIK